MTRVSPPNHLSSLRASLPRALFPNYSARTPRTWYSPQHTLTADQQVTASPSTDLSSPSVPPQRDPSMLSDASQSFLPSTRIDFKANKGSNNLTEKGETSGLEEGFRHRKAAVPPWKKEAVTPAPPSSTNTHGRVTRFFVPAFRGDAHPSKFKWICWMHTPWLPLT